MNLQAALCAFLFRPRVDVQLYSFFDLDTRWALVVSASPRKDPVSIHFTGGLVVPRAGLDERGKSRPPPGFDPLTVKPVAQSLYRLSYPGLLMQPLLILTGLMSSQTGWCLPVHQVECRAEMDTSFDCVLCWVC